MTQVLIRPARDADVPDLAARMRQADRDELWAVAHVLPETGLTVSLERSPLAWAGTVDGVVMCLMGCGSRSAETPQIGIPWMLGAEGLDRHARALVGLSRPYVRILSGVWPLLTNWVDARNTRSIRWLRWLGFTVGDAQPFGAEGLPFHPFEMRSCASS